VRLQLTVRTYKDEVRQRILDSIGRIARGIAEAAGVPAERLPVVEVSRTESTPATYNSPELAERLARTLRTALGGDNVVTWPPIMSSEDFGRFALDGRQIPTFMFWLGAVDPAVIEASRRSGVPPPGLHSSLFAPLPEPAIRTGVRAMTAVVLDLVGKGR
jgi:metal-dependent amidase/aminoacylase/carboxypeptidase family protein